MNDLTVLHEIGTELDPPVAAPPDRLRGRVLSGMAGQARRPMLRSARAASGSRRTGLLRWVGRSRPGWARWVRLPRLGWRLAATGGLAVAVTGALIAAQTLNIGGHGPVANAEAAQILRNAAATAQQLPDLAPRPDQFIFVESKTAYSTTAVTAAGTTTSIEPDLRRIWLSVDGTGDGVLRELPDGGTNWAETALPGCQGGSMVQRKGGTSVETQCEPMPAYLGDLPTDPDAMYRYLYHNSHGGNPRDVQAFITVGDLIRENYVRPPAMAAMFEAAARIPGTTVIRDVVDVAGRHGIAVAQGWRGARSELIFDPETYAYLGEQSVTDKGEMTGGAARLRIAVLDKAGDLPR